MVFKNSFRLVKLFVLTLVLAGTLLAATASAAGRNGSAAAVDYFWHTFYGSTGGDYGAGIATDKDGNVYIVGTSDTAWQGDNATDPKHPFAGQSSIFVLKLDSSGTYQWHTFYGSPDGNGAGGIALDGAGNVYVTGTSSQQWLGDGDKQPLHKVGSGFVLKLNSNGVYRWHTFYKMGAGPVAVDAEGNLLVAGSSDATWKGDGGTKPLHAFTGASDLTVLKLTGAGQYLWHTFYGPASAAGIVVGKDKNVYVSGNTDASWLGDGGTLPLHPYTGAQDVAVLALTGQGIYRWHTFYGSADQDLEGNPAVDSLGNVYVTGTSLESWQGDADTPPLAPHQGGYNLFLLKMDTRGMYLWHTFHSQSNPGTAHLALDQNGAPHVTRSYGYPYNGDYCPGVFTFCTDEVLETTEFTNAGIVQHQFDRSKLFDLMEVGFAAAGIATDRDNNTYALLNSGECPGCFGPGRLHAYAGATDALIIKLNMAEPPPPALVKPANRMVVGKKSPTLDWSDTVNATSYNLQLRQDSRSGTLIADTGLSVSTFKTPPLVRGTKYLWRVQACGENGCSAWTGWWKFSVKAK